MVRKIQDFHMDTRGWWDIGYHYLIGQDGYAYEGRGWDHQGAQVKHWNKVSLGISVMGNFMNVTPNDAALHTVKGLIDCALQKGKLNHKHFTVHGHRDGGQTSCPGTAYYELIQDWPHYGGPLKPTGNDATRQTPIIAAALMILVSFAAFLPMVLV
ncbi:hypothetical protein NP493_874g00007 [Ridgeia piscesae]|uniref:Peptidoglycan recognition protein family domain-containing protein n=1 Tax=Ridgeia piscesae TaxID=27915 RepID=A0AAD9KMK9_RIDPI|nr:hypothetical protein NP493_874g00007 [Ridgeia piscesae]